MKEKFEEENSANEKNEMVVEESKQEEIKETIEEKQPKVDEEIPKKQVGKENKHTKSKKKTSKKANTMIETAPKEEETEEVIVHKEAEVTILGQAGESNKETTKLGTEQKEDKKDIKKEGKRENQNYSEEKKEEINQEEMPKNNEQKQEIEAPKEEEEKTEAPKLEEEPVKAKKSHRGAKVIAILITILLLIGLAGSTVFALINKGSDKIVEGVQIKGISVSGLTREEAEIRLNEYFGEQLKKEISLKHGEYETKLTPEQIELKFKVTEAVELAYSRGRTGNILKDNYDILNTKWNVFDITPEYTYNDELLTNFITGMQENLPDIVKQSSYSIEGSKLNIYKGEKGVAIEVEPLKKQILEAGVNFNSDNLIEMPIVEVQPDPIDLNKIRNEIYKEPKNAYYTQNPFTIYPHVNGVDLAVSIEEAQNQVNASTDVNVVIPLKITTPSVTTNHIGTEAFPDLLATFSTTFSTSNGNRTTNIRLASNKINGVVLLPGESFYYNKVVGQRTAAAGFKSAGVYVNGRVENGIGGGICQVSSTLYNTVLRANLEIVKRSNHYFATGYVPLSTDATVSWGGPEFAFKNSRKYPIKVVSSVNGGKITVSIYGCKEEVEYEVIIQSQTLQTIPMKTEYRVNPSLPQGTIKTVQKGHGGYKSRAYRILKLNGREVSRQLLSTDTYAQLSTIIEKNP